MSEQDKQAAQAKSEAKPTGKTDKVEKASKSEKAAKAPDKKKGNSVKRWFKDLKGELKKVTWPSAKDTMKNVLVVIVCVLVVGVLIWLFDWVLRLVVDALLNLFG